VPFEPAKTARDATPGGADFGIKQPLTGVYSVVDFVDRLLCYHVKQFNSTAPLGWAGV
jgi:hypothetical protein